MRTRFVLALLFLSLVLPLVVGCGGGGGAGAPAGSPIVSSGTYSGQETWTAGSVAGTSNPIVAVVATGNRIVVSGNPGPGNVPYNGFAATPAVIANGAFNLTVARGYVNSYILPAAVISGLNVPTAVPQLTGTMTDEVGDRAAFWLGIQQGTNNPFAGWYTGSMAGAVTAPITLAVGPDGVFVAVQAGLNVWAPSAIGTVYATSGALTFTGTNPGVTFTGAAQSNGTATGTYTFSGTGSGTWTVSRQ